MRGDRQGLLGGALIENGQHCLSEIAGVHAVTGAGQGNCQSAGCAAHVQQRVGGIQGEQAHQPKFIVAGGGAGEGCGAVVPVVARVAVESGRGGGCGGRRSCRGGRVA